MANEAIYQFRGAGTAEAIKIAPGSPASVDLMLDREGWGSWQVALLAGPEGNSKADLTGYRVEAWASDPDSGQEIARAHVMVVKPTEGLVDILWLAEQFAEFGEGRAAFATWSLDMVSESERQSLIRGLIRLTSEAIA